MLFWSTDIHLDHLRPESQPYRDWINELTTLRETWIAEAPALLLTGDLAESSTLISWLKQVADDSQLSLYFVLGNHDYYHSSIVEVRRQLNSIEDPRLFWLDRAGPLKLTSQLSLVGSGGWGDGRVGNFMETPIRINDHLLIHELTLSSRAELGDLLAQLGAEEAQRVQAQLYGVDTPQVIVATHVPPFRESTWYEGRFGDWEWMPDFCCGAMGDMLLEYAQAHPQRQITVYCGHTHGEGVYKALPNLHVFTGRAQYGAPRVQGVINSEGILLDQERYPRSDLAKTREA